MCKDSFDMIIGLFLSPGRSQSVATSADSPKSKVHANFAIRLNYLDHAHRLSTCTGLDLGLARPMNLQAPRPQITAVSASATCLCIPPGTPSVSPHNAARFVA